MASNMPRKTYFLDYLAKTYPHVTWYEAVEGEKRHVTGRLGDHAISFKAKPQKMSWLVKEKLARQVEDLEKAHEGDAP